VIGRRRKSAMNRKAFLLGFYSIGGQVLLLRELVSSLNGDELFIGTALFGWLISVAVGAYLGGSARQGIRPTTLFTMGALLLPVVIIAARLSPLLVTDIVGEIIPFSTAALLSIIMMMPVGVTSGWLFPSITRENRDAPTSIVQVYLFEGIGAFAGGLTIVMLVGAVFSALQMSIVVGIVVIAGLVLFSVSRKVVGIIATVTVAAALLIIAKSVVADIDTFIEQFKYKSYHLEQSFDTHYGHQTILSRDSTYILLTDNTIEAVYPNLETAENLLIPPLIYKPDARKVLFLGRSEFGLAQLADSLPGLSITALDPRQELTSKIDSVIGFSEAVRRQVDDPVAFFTRPRAGREYDIIILNVGELDSYKNSRLLTTEATSKAKTLLKSDGMIFFPTRYDSDRYITAEERRLLSVIYNVLKDSFGYVTLWPGNMTLMFASDASLLDIPYDSIIARLSDLPYTPQYISENYLRDRLDEFKTERLRSVLAFSNRVNTLNRPILPHYQAMYRAKASAFDRRIMSIILGKPAWVVVIPILILLFFAFTGMTRARKKRYGLFLYFTAGIVSLSLELICFYVYQSSAGSLYLEMAVLIGAFMLGLAFGTYYSMRIRKGPLEYPALLMLLAATLLFLFTFDSVKPQALLFYHLFFLFVVAAATGSLFVAATNRYYPTGLESNRGAGYACELIGSSVGALLTATILLPVTGLQWLLIAVSMLVVLSFAGSILTREGR
jgi:spermidine synthase